jgi:hypothetical protein
LKKKTFSILIVLFFPSRTKKACKARQKKTNCIHIHKNK